MHRQPSGRSFSDFSQRNSKKKTAKGTKEIKTSHTSSSFNYGEESSSLSPLSASSPSYWDTSNTVFHLPGTSRPETLLRYPHYANYAIKESNPTFDAAQHKKILEMLTSNVKETTWSCRQCLYDNHALHVNICANCKSSRLVLVSQNSKNISLNEQGPITLDEDQRDNFQLSKGGDIFLKDQSWTCRNCTLINNSNSLTCEACCASKLQSLSISDDMTSEKDELWFCPSCTLENPSTALECAACRTLRVKSKSCKHSRTGKKTTSSKATSNCKQNPAVPSTTRKGDKPKDNTREKILNVYNNGIPNLAKDLSAGFKPWRCSICTFENSRSEIICDMCKNMHNNISDTNQPAQLSQEEIADLQWNHIVTNCKMTKSLYVDETFPAIPSSLYYSPANTTDEDVKWLRLRNITVENSDEHLSWVVFRNLLEPSDVCQGELGDCWFLSALSVLVEREDLIRAVIITKQLCPQGMYQVRLCKDGTWTVVTLDDLFPCDKDGVLLYSQAIRKQLWVPLIEKAMAKIHGCYESLICGSSIEGLATLTGAPCDHIPLQPISPSDIVDVDLIWTQLVSSRQALFLMGTVCGGNNIKIEEAEFEKKGLHPCHVYSILDIRTISKHRLLQLRDPYGLYELYYASRWTPQMQTKLPPCEPESGVFWIDFNDVLKYFSFIGICKIRSGWNEMRLSGVLPPLASQQELTCISLTVHEPTEIDLILYQNSQREIDISERTQVDLCVVLLKAKGDASYSYNLVTNSKREIQRFVGCYEMLEPAEYIIIPLAFNHWNLELAAESYPRYVLAIHSSKKISAEQVTSSPQALADTIISMALIHGEPQELLDCFNVYYLTKNFSGAAIIAENKYQHKWVHLKCEDDTESYNIVSTRGLKDTVDSIPPLHRQVVAVFTKLKENDRFFTAHQLNYRIANSSELGDWGSTGMLHIPEINYQTDGLHVPRLI